MNNNWEKVRLGDVCKVVGGGTPSTNHDEYWEGDISWITPKDLTGYTNIYINKGERCITQQGLKDSSAHLLPSGAVLLTTRAPIGYVAIALTELCTNQGFKSFIADKEKLHNLFLYYWLKGNTKHLQSIGTGTTFMEIPAKRAKEIKIPLPPLPTQQAIAATLSCLDDKIELNNRINANLEAQAQAIFKSWFVDFEPFKDGEFIESELGRIPKGWRIGQLKDLCFYSNTKTIVTNLTDLTYISTENMLSNKAGYMKAKSLPSINQTPEILQGDILVSNIRPYFKKIILCNFRGGCSTDVLCFRPIEQYYSAFIYYILYDDRFFDYMTSGSKGTKMPRGDKQHIMNYPIIIPNMDEFIKFSDLLTPLSTLNDKLTIESRTLAAIRDALLPKLMSGEIDVEGKEAYTIRKGL